MHLKNNLSLVTAACLAIGVWLFTRAHTSDSSGWYLLTVPQLGRESSVSPLHSTGVLEGAGPVEITSIPVSARAPKIASHSCLLLRLLQSSCSLSSGAPWALGKNGGWPVQLSHLGPSPHLFSMLPPAVSLFIACCCKETLCDFACEQQCCMHF